MERLVAVSRMVAVYFETECLINRVAVLWPLAPFDSNIGRMDFTQIRTLSRFFCFRQEKEKDENDERSSQSARRMGDVRRNKSLSG
jgi:hypothetical protein